MIITVVAAFTLAVFSAMNMKSEMLSMVAGITGLVLFLIEMNLEMKTARELEKQRRLRKRWLARRQKLKENRMELDDAMLEKNQTEIFNVQEEETEIDSELLYSMCRRAGASGCESGYGDSGETSGKTETSYRRSPAS